MVEKRGQRLRISARNVLVRFAALAYVSAVLLLVDGVPVPPPFRAREEAAELIHGTATRKLLGVGQDPSQREKLLQVLMDAANGRSDREPHRTQVPLHNALMSRRFRAQRGRKQHIKTVVYTKVNKQKKTGPTAGQARVSAAGKTDAEGKGEAVVRLGERERTQPSIKPGATVKRSRAQLGRASRGAATLDPPKIDNRKAAASPSKGHVLDPALRRRCAKTNHSQSTYLKTTQGLHLLYPETWSGTDFVYHKNYGTAGQIRIPVLMNQNIDTLIKETFTSLISDSEFSALFNTTSCAVVDSNAGVEGLGGGESIDSHSVVFRYGKPTLPPTRMVSLNDTGTKATFRTITNDNLASILQKDANGEYRDLKNMEPNVTLLLFNKRATDMSSIRQWVSAHNRLLRALRHSGRSDVKALMMSPLAYTGVKMALLDVAKCLQAGGGRVQCRTPAPTSKISTLFAATKLCGRVTLYGNYAMAQKNAGLSCSDVQKALIRTMAADKQIRVCGKSGCSNSSTA